MIRSGSDTAGGNFMTREAFFSRWSNSSWKPYVQALLAVLIAWAVQAAVGDFFGAIFSFAPFVGAALIVAWLGGLRPTLLALIGGYLIAVYFHVHPGSLLVVDRDGAAALVVYLFIGLSTGFLAESLHRARRAAEATSERLQKSLTALGQSEQTAQERLALLDLVYDTAPVGLGLMNDQGSFIRINHLLASMMGGHRDQCLNRTLSELLPQLKDELEPICETVQKTGEAAIGHEITVQEESQQPRYWLTSFFPVHEGQALPVGISCVALDITSRKLVEHALQDADQRKNEFLAMLAHELRNPLAAIRYAVQLSQMPGMTMNEFNWFESIERQIHHLSRLVDDLLDLSRVSSGKIQLQRQRVDVTSIIRRAVDVLRPSVRERNHQLSVVLKTEPLWVEVDSTRIEQVFQNLLHNAVKYTEPGGRIEFSAVAEDSEAVIAVKDTGTGLAPELLPYVFDLFTQGTRTLDRSQGGLGIGLTLVRRIVEMHGGSVSASSQGVGRGSIFSIRLPRSAAPVTTCAPTEDPQAAAQPTTPPRPLRVLIVEDNLDAAKALQLLLRTGGHTVTICHDGLVALDTARQAKPDVVLLDIGLPGKDGFQVAQEFRSTPDLSGLTILGLSGYGQANDRERASQAGFDALLVKPVDLSSLNRFLQCCQTSATDPCPRCTKTDNPFATKTE